VDGGHIGQKIFFSECYDIRSSYFIFKVIIQFIIMSFPYKNVLVLGATSGIGLGFAERMIENGIHVIAVGRRKENLESLQQRYGKDKVSIYQFDITDLKSIPSFATKYTSPPSIPSNQLTQIIASPNPTQTSTPSS
jgi:hypothetical protein